MFRYLKKFFYINIIYESKNFKFNYDANVKK